MSVKRVCLALGLVCLQATAASVNDENCLVQSQRDVVSKRQDALTPDLPSMLASFKHVDLSGLKHLLKQFPMPSGGATPGMPAGMPPGMEQMGNFSMTDMMNYAMEFLKLLKDDKVVDVMFEGIKNVSAGLLATSHVILVSAKKLDKAVDNSTKPEEVLDALKVFMTSLVKEVTDSAANITINSRKFWALVPADNKLKKMAQPMLDMMENATKSDVTTLITSMADGAVAQLTTDKTNYCNMYAGIQGNLTVAKKFLEEEGSTTVESAKAMLPQVLPMLQGFAPDVAPTVMELINATFKVMEVVIASAQESIPAAVDAITKASKDKLHCAVLVSDDQSGAPLRARFGLAAALAAAVAWMTAA